MLEEERRVLLELSQQRLAVGLGEFGQELRRGEVLPQLARLELLGGDEEASERADAVVELSADGEARRSEGRGELHAEALFDASFPTRDAVGRFAVNERGERF